MKANVLIAFSLFISMLLSVVSMPEWALWARPEWPLLVLIYWSLAAPERCGIMVAALVGLFQDSLTASLLGKHMLAYSLAIAVTLLAYKRLRMFDVWKQAGFIFLLLKANTTQFSLIMDNTFNFISLSFSPDIGPGLFSP